MYEAIQIERNSSVWIYPFCVYCAGTVIFMLICRDAIEFTIMMLSLEELSVSRTTNKLHDNVCFLSVFIEANALFMNFKIIVCLHKGSSKEEHLKW